VCGGGHGVDWNEKNHIIQCLGCESVSFRVVSTFSEDYDYDHEGNLMDKMSIWRELQNGDI